MEERGQIERASRRMSLCHKCVASKFKQKSAYKVLKLSHTTTNNMPCYTQRAETLNRPIRGPNRADWQLIQPITKPTQVVKLLWWGRNTAVTNQSHNWQPSWPIKKQTAFIFLTSSSSPPLLWGEGSEEIKQYDSSSLLQIRRSLFTDRHEQQPTGFWCYRSVCSRH